MQNNVLANHSSTFISLRFPVFQVNSKTYGFHMHPNVHKVLLLGAPKLCLK